MKKSTLLMLLLCLMGVAGSLTAMAQTPEPSGQWKFDDTSDLMAATVGNVTLSPVVLGSASVSPATVSEAGITADEGPNGSSAIFVPAASALKVTRAEGAAASMSFSFMIDLSVPNAYVYDGLFQTSTGNSNDGEIFISKSQIGANAMGGYFGCIWDFAWYRVVFTNDGGKLKLYVNGVKLTEYETTNTRWEIDPVFYLLADEDGEVSDTYVSEVAFWETPLTDEEAIALGSLDNFPWITDASQIKEGDQFYIISDRAKFAGTKTAKPKAMSTYQSNYTTSNWGEQYVYWGDLKEENDAYIWTAEKVGDQWAFLNKENSKYIGNMNTSPEEADVVFSDDPVGYTLTDLAEGAGRFYMTNDESEHSLHVQGYKRSDRESNSLAKQNVGDDDYSEDAPTCGYPGRWRLLKLNADEPVDPRTQIGTPEEFEAFAQAVADGNTELDAVLTADIELTGNVMVGTSTNQFAGTFDGDGHTVTYNYDITTNYCGLFSYVNGATIRNLKVEGSVTSTAIHFGALIGRAAGTVLVENVVTDVDITGNRSGVTGDGGMLGANYANITFNNCAVLGPMGNPGSSMYSPFSAFSDGKSSTTLNNCYSLCSLKESTGTGNCFTLTHSGGTNTLNNCYYLNLIGTLVGGTQITAEQVASGELCYILNGDQSTIGWYQTLGTDAYPVPFATSAQVYANGELKCDGTSAGGTLVYSNSATSTVPPHTYVDGWCSVCGKLDVNYLAADSEGYFSIGTAHDLAWYADFLAQGNPCGNVRLTADIDLSTSDYPNTMIATEGNKFVGIFDGQEHTITYNYTSVTEKWRGLFRAVDGATIRNLRVEGSATPSNIHFGALIGVAYGTVLVENVVTNVNITGTSTVQGAIQGDAGMLGANYANITFNNCATLGEMGNSGTSMYSSFSAWSHGDSHTTLNNCYTTCKLTEGTGTGYCFTLTHEGGPITLNDCYYLNTVGTVQGTLITEDLASGEFCYKLNGDQSTISWYQTLGTDAYPVPFATSEQVYANGELKCDGTAAEGGTLIYSNSATSVVPPHTFEDGWCSVCGKVDVNYLAADSEGYYSIGTAHDLAWYADLLAQGNPCGNVRLTADIDLSTSDYPDLMIGTENNEYAGIFDGGGHTITYHYALVADKWRGLFAFVNGATIRNLYVEGSAIATNIHYGALIGRAYGTVLVENVITNVDITGQRSGVTGDGGMLGANYANITFNNCATLGEMGYEGSSMYSSFSAWSNGSSATTLNNCYSLCKKTEGTGDSNCFTLTHKSGTVVINNSYYLNLIGTYVGGTQVTEEQVASGELCYMLGGAFTQLIGTDAYPKFDSAPVDYVGEAGYATLYDPENGYTLNGDVTANVATAGASWLTLTEIENVPAGTPVVLKGTYYNKLAEDLPAINVANDLKGTDADTEADGTMYVLAQPEGEEVGFYKATGTIPTGKAYYQSTSEVKAFYFDADGATGISDLNVDLNHNESIYNLSGQRISKMQKGINIVNGKKVLF